jgi:hypothetical protein
MEECNRNYLQDTAGVCWGKRRCKEDAADRHYKTSRWNTEKRPWSGEIERSRYDVARQDNCKKSGKGIIIRARAHLF